MKQPHETVFNWNSDSSTPGVTKLVEQFVHLLAEYQWPETNVFEIHTALVELINNAVEHGNQFDVTKKVFLSGRISRNRVRLSVRDEGNGFDHKVKNVLASIPAPCDLRGRGLFLVHNFTTRVTFNKTGNEVILEKRIVPVGSSVQRE